MTDHLIEATGPANFTVKMGHTHDGHPTSQMTDHYTVEYWLILTPEGIANPNSRLPQDVPPVYYTIAADDLADARRHFRRTHEYLVRMAAACPNPRVALERMRKTIPLLPLKPMDSIIFHQEFRQQETA